MLKLTQNIYKNKIAKANVKYPQKLKVTFLLFLCAFLMCA